MFANDYYPNQGAPRQFRHVRPLRCCQNFTVDMMLRHTNKNCGRDRTSNSRCLNTERDLAVAGANVGTSEREGVSKPLTGE